MNLLSFSCIPVSLASFVVIKLKVILFDIEESFRVIGLCLSAAAIRHRVMAVVLDFRHTHAHQDMHQYMHGLINHSMKRMSRQYFMVCGRLRSFGSSLDSELN